jgi:hypothetical protein
MACGIVGDLPAIERPAEELAPRALSLFVLPNYGRRRHGAIAGHAVGRNRIAHAVAGPTATDQPAARTDAAGAAAAIVEESDGDLMGDGVNIAARLEDIAKPGAIWLSEQAYRQVKPRRTPVVPGETLLTHFPPYLRRARSTAFNCAADRACLEK